MTLRLVDDPVFDEPEPGELVPLDFAKVLAAGIPKPDYLDPPYTVKGARHWWFGAAESAKTIAAQDLAAKLTRQGRTVVFVSAENPLATDLDRMTRLRPEFERLRYFHMPVLDLAVREQFVELARVCAGADLVVLDTLSALWSGDENSNVDVVNLDRDVLVPLVRLTGAGLVVIHHTGHPQAFVSRGGANAGRGASAMGQKADIVLVFQAVGLREFTITHAKNRTPGGQKAPVARFSIVDTEDGGLDIVAEGRHVDPRVADAVEEAVGIITSLDGIGTNALKLALRELGYGGSTVDPALAELRQEGRVEQVDGFVTGQDGKRRRGKPWVATK